MKLHLYNTETRLKEEVIPLKGNTIRMYTCGPTVYNFAHLGNFRAYVFEDLLRRTLKYFGFQVEQVMNLTDVDDKTLKGAIANKITLLDFTKPYKDAFFEDLKILNVEPVEHYPAATDYIGEMIAIIEKLEKEGIAYRGADGSVYYAINRFPSYGRLSHLRLNELEAGASDRVAADEYDKESVADFVLWKSYDPARDGDIFWESPFGPGRPGWHIECSAMAMKLLGPSIDIHVGGVDNIFPHHENEIAQSEAYSSERFVRHWAHCEHLLVDHKKMSKSLGNFYTLRDLLDRGYTATQIRYMLLQGHYRTQLNFTFQGLDGVAATLQRLSDFIDRMRSIKSADGGKVAQILETTEKEFKEALADDLNISVALAAIFEMVRKVNTLCDHQQIGEREAKSIIALLTQFDQVLGVLPLQPQTLKIPHEMEELLTKRNAARAAKNWAESDRYRDLIHAAGYTIEDSPQGSRLKKI